MRLSRTVATMVTGTLVAGGAVVAAAAPAAAADYGTQLTGQIYMLANAGGFAANAASDVVTSGNGTVRPFQSLQLDTACPAGTAAVQVYVQIPKSGAPRSDWDSTPLTALGTVKDDKGRFMTGRGDTMARATVVTYLATQPNNAGTLPLDVVCLGANAGEVYGYFETTLTAKGTSRDDFTWSVPAPTGTYPGGGSQVAADTTTALAGAVSGKDLVLTATVSPSAAAGTVTFKDGDTTLGTAAVQGGVASYTVTAPAAGAHSYSAAFAPTDAAAYKASSGTYTVQLGIDAATGQLVLTVPAAPVVDGSLTFSVPFDTPVQLAGSRSSDNSRITATAAFPTVTVTDTRRDGLLSHWQVNAQASDFTGTGGTIGAKYLGWAPTSSATADSGSPLVTRNGATVPSFLDDPSTTGLGVSRMLGESATPGRGTAKLGAALNLAIPATTAEGQYTATVTVTLVSD